MDEARQLDIINKIKEYSKAIRDKKPVSELHRKAIEQQDYIRAHSDLDYFPEFLFRAKAPNESDAEFEYRKKIYQPITAPFFSKVISTVNRIWNEQNWNIDWNEYKETEYFTTDYPVYNNIFLYFKQVVTRSKLTDPNALIAVLPFRIPTKPDGTPDQSKPIEPFAFIFKSEKVLYYDYTDMAIVLNRTDIEIKRNGRPSKTGLQFILIDKNTIYHITQTGEYSNNEYEITEYYRHELNYLPCYKLGGKPKILENEIYYESYFLPAVPNLNVALSAHNTFLISFYKNMFPREWEYYEPCDYSGCENGYIIDLSNKDNPVYKKCPACKGTGSKQTKSPSSVYQVRLPDSMTPEQLRPPFFGWESPNPNILDFSYNVIYNEIERAYSILNIEISNSSVKGSETALGKMIDREELFTFLKSISDEIFALLENVIIDTIYMRNPDISADALPVITPPKTFQMRGYSDITREVTEATTAGLPQPILHRLNKEYVGTRFNKDDELKYIIDLYYSINPFAGMKPEEISLAITSGQIPRYYYTLHINFWNILSELEREIDIKNTDLIDLKRRFIEKARAISAEANQTPITDLAGLITG